MNISFKIVSGEERSVIPDWVRMALVDTKVEVQY